MSGRVITKTQVSAGGVVFRRRGRLTEVVLISVGEQNRWQLPKGLVDAGESPEDAALREAREETGLDAELVAPIEKIEYWYFSTERGARALPQVRAFLLRPRVAFFRARAHDFGSSCRRASRASQPAGGRACATLLQSIDGSTDINTSI
jgi:8-oxo-dGTP pyrophosphatase MutT (NUDIX family)